MSFPPFQGQGEHNQADLKHILQIIVEIIQILGVNHIYQFFSVLSGPMKLLTFSVTNRVVRKLFISRRKVPEIPYMLSLYTIVVEETESNTFSKSMNKSITYIRFLRASAMEAVILYKYLVVLLWGKKPSCALSITLFL